MRICESCKKPDGPIVDYEKACKPELCPPTADERPETHHDRCPKLEHDVVRLERPVKLIHTPKHPEGELELKYRLQGWKLLKDGNHIFRYRMLCRACIQRIFDIEERHKDYLKACKKAAGKDDQTYSQLLAMQSMI